MFIVPLYIIAKTCKQPKCLLTGEWIKKMCLYVCVCVCVCVCIMEYCSAVKKNEIMPFIATWMDLEIILSKVSQTENIYHLYVESKKKRYK